MEWVTAGNALDAQPNAFGRAVALNCLKRVLGAGRCIDAMASKQGRYDPLIPSDGTQTPPRERRGSLCDVIFHLSRTKLLQQTGKCLGDFRWVAVVRLPGGKKNDLLPITGQVALTSSLSQDPLASVPVNGVSKPFRRDEGDLTWAAFVILQHRYAHEPMVGPLPTGEDRLKFPSGFDGLHASP